MGDAGSQPEPQPADGDDSPPECFVCIEEGSASSALLRGCACRGGAGHVHMACLVGAAQAMAKMWHACPTCKQRWTGSLQLELARARRELAGDLQKDVDERLDAALDLTEALWASGQYPEALQLGRETLATAQRVYGDDHGFTGAVAGTLGYVHGAMGNHSVALPLQTKALAIAQRLDGSEHANTLTAKGNLAMTHRDMGSSNELALSMYIEVLESQRRVLGSENIATLRTMGNVATLHTEMGNDELALPLQRAALEAKRRVLGSQHPQTLMSVLNLGMTLGDVGDHAAEMLLLQEALAGFTAAYGPEHPHTHRCQSELEGCEQCLADPRVAAEHQRMHAATSRTNGQSSRHHRSHPRRDVNPSAQQLHGARRTCWLKYKAALRHSAAARAR